MAVGAVAVGADVGAVEAWGVRAGVADVAPVQAATTAIMTKSAPLAANERTLERLTADVVKTFTVCSWLDPPSFPYGRDTAIGSSPSCPLVPRLD